MLVDLPMKVLPTTFAIRWLRSGTPEFQEISEDTSRMGQTVQGAGVGLRIGIETLRHVPTKLSSDLVNLVQMQALQLPRPTITP